MKDKTSEEEKKLKELLNNIGYEIRGRYPNKRIYSPNGEYTCYRVKGSYIELNKDLDNLCSCTTNFHFKEAKIEMIDNDCVSVGTNECFVLFMNHNIEQAKDGE